MRPPPQDRGPPGPRDAHGAPRAPSPRHAPHPQHPSGSGPHHRQTSWVTPLLKGPLLTDAYQPHLLGPLHPWPSAFLPPIRAPGGLRLQGHQGLPWPGRLRAHPASQPPAPMRSPQQKPRTRAWRGAGASFQPNRETEAHPGRTWVREQAGCWACREGSVPPKHKAGAPLEPRGGFGHLTTSGAVLPLLHKLDNEMFSPRPPRPCVTCPGPLPGLPSPSLRLAHSVPASWATSVPAARQARSSALRSAGWPGFLSRPRVGELILCQRHQQSPKRPYPNTPKRGKSSGGLQGCQAQRSACSRVRIPDACLAVTLDKPLPALCLIFPSCKMEIMLPSSWVPHPVWYTAGA